MLKQVVYSLCLLIALGWLAACTPTVEPASDTQVVETDQQQVETSRSPLEELAIRALVPRYGEMDPAKAQLLPGELPPAFALPLPDDAALVGSFVNGDIETTVIFDSAQTPEAIMAFFDKAMPQSGWDTAVPLETQSGGFVGGIDDGRSYCHDDMIMWLSAYAVENGPTDARLILRPEEGYSPCESIDYGSEPVGAMAILPALITPEKTIQTSGGGSGGSERDANSNATLETELDLSTLADSYLEQLEAAGWTLQSSEKNDLAATSAWTFTDDEGNGWQGVFLAVQWSDNSQKVTVYLEIAQSPE